MDQLFGVAEAAGAVVDFFFLWCNPLWECFFTVGVVEAVWAMTTLEVAAKKNNAKEAAISFFIFFLLKCWSVKWSFPFRHIGRKDNGKSSKRGSMEFGENCDLGVDNQPTGR